MKTNIKIKISVSLIVVAIGITAITLEARTSDSFFFRTASAVTCNSTTDCETPGWEKDAADPSACCNAYTQNTGHKEGIRPPKKKEE